MKRSALPLILVLIAAPFFADYHEHPLKFGLLQGFLLFMISVVGAGGISALRERLKKPAFAAFWVLVLALSVAAPFALRN